jgi:hypothetical protein
MNNTNPMNIKYHQVDHLFLLIGENPLPNYVAAKTLLKSTGKPYLVYTKYTENAANRLRDILGLTEHEKVPLENNESNAFEIKKRIKGKVEELQKKYPEHKHFGLNYTGGTKAMAVHAYQVLIDLRLLPEPTFSYIDPRNLEILIDQKNSQIPFDVLDAQIKQSLQMSFERLFDLHDLRWKPNDIPITKPSLPQASKEILQIYLNNRSEIAKPYQNWCESQLWKSKKKNYRGIYTYWLDEPDLATVILDITDLPAKIKPVFNKYLGAAGNQLSLQEAKKKGFQQFSHICGWLNCGWFEDYVLAEVQKIPSNLKIDESAMSFHIEDPDNVSAEWDKFEFDVAFRRCYQLFALSCTTAIYDNVCKEKLFEAYVRARQLGGAEARVALVCPHNDPARLEKQLKVLTQDRRIAVFGQKHLMNLSQAIAKWVEGKNY